MEGRFYAVINDMEVTIDYDISMTDVFVTMSASDFIKLTGCTSLSDLIGNDILRRFKIFCDWIVRSKEDKP